MAKKGLDAYELTPADYKQSQANIVANLKEIFGF